MVFSGAWARARDGRTGWRVGATAEVGWASAGHLAAPGTGGVVGWWRARRPKISPARPTTGRQGTVQPGKGQGGAGSADGMGMTVIRVTCGGCGDVELSATEMRVRRCVETGHATYVFTCPDCHMVEVRTAEDHVVEVLRSAGVACAEWQLPAELRGIEDRATADPRRPPRLPRSAEVVRLVLGARDAHEDNRARPLTLAPRRGLASPAAALRAGYGRVMVVVAALAALCVAAVVLCVATGRIHRASAGTGTGGSRPNGGHRGGVGGRDGPLGPFRD